MYEHLTITTPTVDNYTVPDSNFRAGNFSEILGTAPVTSDDLGRSVYPGQVYDPRSGHLITAGQADTPSPANPYGTGLTAVNNDGQCTPTCYIRNPIPGNILSNLPGYAPDPVGTKLLSYYPTPTINSALIANNLVVSGSAPARSNEYGIRVDHNLNANTRAYFRYSYKQETKTGAAADWGNDPAGIGDMRPNNRWGMWAGYSQVFNPTLTMNLSAGVSIWHEVSNLQSWGFDSTQLGLPAYITEYTHLFPNVNVGGESGMGGQGNNQYEVNHGPIGDVSADFIKVHGKHTLNFGAMGVEQINDFTQNEYQAALAFEGGFTTGPNPLVGSGYLSGNGVAEMLLGILDSASVTTPYLPMLSNHLFGRYIQDDWRPTRHLTLNLGFRYDIQTPFIYRHNLGSVFNPDALNPISYAVGTPYMGALQYLGPGHRYVSNPHWDNFAPRLGLSYQPVAKTVIHGGYGIFYPESAATFSADSNGFAATTAANTTLDGGITPNPNISTSSPWGGVYEPIVGNANGAYEQDGNGVSSNFSERSTEYVEQWMLGVQHAFTNSDQIDVNYIGNRGVRLILNNQYNQLNPKYLADGSTYLNAEVPNPLASALSSLAGQIGASYCVMDSPTVIRAQLLVPYPEYCAGGVGQLNNPAGQSLYNALQVTYNHRVSKGLTAQISYTYSKFLDDTEGVIGWGYNGPEGAGVTPANNYNLAGDKSVDGGGDIPQALVASYVYQLPFGRGKTFGSGMGRIANAVAVGWELSGIATFKGGIPIGVYGNDYDSFGGNPRPDVTGNVHVSHPSYKEWFNTGAFQYAPYGTFGTAPRYFSNLRGPRYQDWDTVMEKNWKITERYRFQFRFETFNTFNHPNFYTPTKPTITVATPIQIQHALPALVKSTRHSPPEIFSGPENSTGR